MNFEQLIHVFEQTHGYMQKRAVSAVNQSLTMRNWLYGYYIVEYEQNGEDTAKYGDKLISNLSKTLTGKYLKGFSTTNLKLYRQFYIIYPGIGHLLTDQLIPKHITGEIEDKIKKKY